jgi:hypothetical protein
MEIWNTLESDVLAMGLSEGDEVVAEDNEVLFTVENRVVSRGNCSSDFVVQKRSQVSLVDDGVGHEG